jgi:hypothetical protein
LQEKSARETSSAHRTSQPEEPEQTNLKVNFSNQKKRTRRKEPNIQIQEPISLSEYKPIILGER